MTIQEIYKKFGEKIPKKPSVLLLSKEAFEELFNGACLKTKPIEAFFYDGIPIFCEEDVLRIDDGNN